MALKYQNNYYKIISIVKDYTINSTIICAKRYCSENDRLREKELLDKVNLFKEKADKYLEKLIVDFTTSLPAFNNETEALEYIMSNTELKEYFDKLDNMRLEFNTCLATTLYEDIDINSLKYLDLWKSLGFEESMKDAVKFITQPKYIKYEQLVDIDLEQAYLIMKEQLVGSEDC